MENYQLQTSNTNNSTGYTFRKSYFNYSNYDLINNNINYNYNYDYYDYNSLRIKQMDERDYAEAFNAGIEEGKDRNIETYFEMFKKLILPYPEGYKREMIEEVFGTSNIFEIINNYKGKEIINMIKDYYNKI